MRNGWSRALGIVALVGAWDGRAPAEARVKDNSRLRLPTPGQGERFDPGRMAGENMLLADVDGDGKKDLVGWAQSQFALEISAVGVDWPVARIAFGRNEIREGEVQHVVRRAVAGHFHSRTRESICFLTKTIHLHGDGEIQGDAFCYQAWNGHFERADRGSVANEWSLDLDYTVGDFDDDGLDEVIAYRRSIAEDHAQHGLQLYLLRHRGSGGFGLWREARVGNLDGLPWFGSVELHTAQLDQGPDDLVVFSPTRRTISAYYGVVDKGTPTFWWAHNSAGPYVKDDEEVRVADLDGDGRDDLVLHDTLSGAIRFKNPRDAHLPHIAPLAVPPERALFAFSRGALPRYDPPKRHTLHFGALRSGGADRRDDAIEVVGDVFNVYHATREEAPFTLLGRYTYAHRIWWNAALLRGAFGFSSDKPAVPSVGSGEVMYW